MIQGALHNQCVGNRSIFLSASPHLPVLWWVRTKPSWSETGYEQSGNEKTTLAQIIYIENEMQIRWESACLSYSLHWIRGQSFAPRCFFLILVRILKHFQIRHDVGYYFSEQTWHACEWVRTTARKKIGSSRGGQLSQFNSPRSLIILGRRESGNIR